MKNKKVIKIIILLLILILFIPVPYRLKDGGSNEYKAITYTITKYHRLNNIKEKNPYIEGIAIKILGLEIYNSTY